MHQLHDFECSGIAGMLLLKLINGFIYLPYRCLFLLWLSCFLNIIDSVARYYEATDNVLNIRYVTRNLCCHVSVLCSDVTEQEYFQPDSDNELPGFRSGAQAMPPKLAATVLDGKHVFALTYSFERRPGQRNPFLDTEER